MPGYLIFRALHWYIYYLSCTYSMRDIWFAVLTCLCKTKSCPKWRHSLMPVVPSLRRNNCHETRLSCWHVPHINNHQHLQWLWYAIAYCQTRVQFTWLGAGAPRVNPCKWILSLWKCHPQCQNPTMPWHLITVMEMWWTCFKCPSMKFSLAVGTWL